MSFLKNCHFEIFWQILRKKGIFWQFWTFNWQFSGGSGSNLRKVFSLLLNDLVILLDVDSFSAVQRQFDFAFVVPSAHVEGDRSYTQTLGPVDRVKHDWIHILLVGTVV